MVVALWNISLLIVVELLENEKEAKMNKKYEYKVIERTSLVEAETILNTFGREGWELVGYSSDAVQVMSVIRTYQFIFKREIK